MELDMDQEYRPSRRSGWPPFGILKRTVVSSPVVHQLLLCTAANGTKCVVTVRDRSLTIQGVTTDAPAQIVCAAVVKSQRSLEDHVALYLETGFLLLLKIYPDGRCPLVLADVQIGSDLTRTLDFVLEEPAPRPSIATECKGRAMLVRTGFDRFHVYALGDDGAASQDPFAAQDTVTIIDHRFFLLEDSVILDACFLPPLKGADEHHVLLIVLYASADCVLRVGLYEWWANRSIKTMALYGSLPLLTRQQRAQAADIEVPHDEYAGTPLFMVPLLVTNGVVIVTVTELILVQSSDIISGETAYKRCDLPLTPTAFFREPPVHDADPGHEDIFYLSGEDNCIYCVLVDSSGMSVDFFLDLNTLVGDIGSAFTLQAYNVDDTVTVVSTPVLDATYVLVRFAGDFSEGGTVIAKVEEELLEGEEQDEEEQGKSDEDQEDDEQLLLSSMDSWAPVLDFAEHRLRPQYSPELDIFAACGRGPTGSLNHLRFGIKVVPLSSSPIERATKLFSVVDPDAAYLFISYPYKTAAYQVASDAESGEPILMECDESSGFDLEQETIALARVGRSAVVQITPTSVVLSDGQQLHKKHLMQQPVVDAKMHGNAIVLLSAQDDTLVSLQLFRVLIEDADTDQESWLQKVGDEIILPGPVSMVRLEQFESELACFVGTYKPALLKYRVCDSGLQLNHREVDLFDTIPAPGNIPHDLVLRTVTTPDNELMTYALVGLRNGSLLSCEYSAATHKFGSVDRLIKLGDVPVGFALQQDGLTFVLNEQLLALSNDDVLNNPHRIILESTADQKVYGVAQFPSTGGAANTLLALLMKDRLQLVQLHRQPQVVRHHIPLGGRSPRRVVLLKHLKVLAVALAPAWVESSDLVFVDPETYQIVPSTDKSDHQLDHLRGLCEWALTVDGKKYRYLVVWSSGGVSDGWAKILRVSRTKSGAELELSKQFVWTEEGQIMAVAPFQDQYLAFATTQQGMSFIGIKQVKAEGSKRFRMETKRMSQPLKGIVTEIHGVGDFIFVSTTTNSVVAVYFNGEDLKVYGGDSVARSIMCQLPYSSRILDEHSTLILGADKTRFVFGLEFRGTESARRTMDTCVSFRLPSVISRLRAVQFSGIWADTETGATVPEKFIACSVGGSIYELELVPNAGAFATILRRIAHQSRQDEQIQHQFDEFLEQDSAPSGTEPRPLYPGLKWRSAHQESDMGNLVDIDEIMARFGELRVSQWLRQLFAHKDPN